MNFIRTYIKDSIQELYKVTWPTKNQAIRLTGIVLFFTLAAAILIGSLDYLFSFLNKLLIERF